MSNQKCRHCGGKLIRRGYKNLKFSIPGINYQCNNKKCGKYQVIRPRHARTAKILLLDIETMYMEVNRIWSLDAQYISHDSIRKDWSILCWGAKWLFEPNVMGQVVKPEEVVNRTEESIIEGIWKLVDEADIVVHQNGDKFDMPRLNTKFAKWGLPPTSPYLSVDTLKAARSAFYLPSYKLDYVAEYVLGIKGKTKMDIEDWDACEKGDKKALQKMLDYCKRDIAPLLEDWYLYLLPWIKQHPNLNIYTGHDGDTCPHCESQDLSWNIQYPTPQGLWEGFRCNSCGATGRGTSGKKHKIKGTQVVPARVR